MSLLDIKNNIKKSDISVTVELVRKFIAKNDKFFTGRLGKEIFFFFFKEDEWLDLNKPEKIFIVFRHKNPLDNHFRILSFRTMNEIGWTREWEIVKDKMSGKGLRSLTLEKILNYEHI